MAPDLLSNTVRQAILTVRNPKAGAPVGDGLRTWSPGTRGSGGAGRHTRRDCRDPDACIHAGRFGRRDAHAGPVALGSHAVPDSDDLRERVPAVLCRPPVRRRRHIRRLPDGGHLASGHPAACPDPAIRVDVRRPVSRHARLHGRNRPGHLSFGQLREGSAWFSQVFLPSAPGSSEQCSCWRWSSRS